MLAYWILGIFVAFLIFSAYMGMFNKITIKQEQFPGGYFIYYDYRGHFNTMSQFHKNLQKEIGLDTSKIPKMTIVYDDPFNLEDGRQFRAAFGYLLQEKNEKFFEICQKLHFKLVVLPIVNSLYGDFPYRNSISITFGSQRFLPACLTYILRNMKALKKQI